MVHAAQKYILLSFRSMSLWVFKCFGVLTSDSQKSSGRLRRRSDLLTGSLKRVFAMKIQSHSPCLLVSGNCKLNWCELVLSTEGLCLWRCQNFPAYCYWSWYTTCRFVDLFLILRSLTCYCTETRWQFFRKCSPEW